MNQSRPPAPGDLALVEALASTIEFSGHRDDLADLDGAQMWMAAQGISNGQVVDASDLEELRDLRDRLRSLIERPDADAILWLNGMLHDSRLFLSVDQELRAVRVGCDDGVRLRVVAAVANSVADQTWHRLRLCANSAECGVAFYDRSRNRQGRWCSAALCGNRINTRASRQRSGRRV